MTAKLFIAIGTPLRCENCGNEWMAKKDLFPKPGTGVRCPKCHSRFVKKSSGEWAVPSRKKGAKTEEVIKKLRPKAEPSEDAAIVRFERSEGRPIPEERAAKLERLRASLGMERPTRMVSEGAEREIEIGEEEEPEELEAKPLMATDILSIDEIIDIETVVNFHQMEIEALLRWAKAKKDPSYDRIAQSLGKKAQRMIQLVLRDLTIDNALKILLILYIGQQIALVSLVMSSAPEKKEKTHEAKAKTG
jgi:DNA-directed RNA polymerase subunit RPC12/RpoP